MIDLQVRAENGEIVTHGSCGLDWTPAFQCIDENEYPFLCSLLPYADTMFNSRQTVRLRREITNQEVKDILGRDLVAEIERLCLCVENGSHLYLWFLGD